MMRIDSVYKAFYWLIVKDSLSMTQLMPPTFMSNQVFLNLFFDFLLEICLSIVFRAKKEAREDTDIDSHRRKFIPFVSIE